MKRPTRFNANAPCLIPKDVIEWIIIGVATLTVFSFLAIEIHEIVLRRSRSREEINVFETKEIVLRVDAESTSQHSTYETNNTDEIFNITEKAVTLLDLEIEFPKCSNSIFLLVLVASFPDHFKARDAIRSSWANLEESWMMSKPQTKILFLVGRSTEKVLNVLVNNENNIFGDILLGNYTDAYGNRLLKVVHGLVWAWEHCRPVYVLRTADDCFVNLPVLQEFLLVHNPIRTNLYAGRFQWDTPIAKHYSSRWNGYRKGYSKWPHFSGAGYVLSTDVLELIATYGGPSGALANENALVGHVLSTAGVPTTYTARFVSDFSAWKACDFVYVFVVQYVEPERQAELQETSKSANETCSTTGLAKGWV